MDGLKPGTCLCSDVSYGNGYCAIESLITTSSADFGMPTPCFPRILAVNDQEKYQVRSVL